MEQFCCHQLFICADYDHQGKNERQCISSGKRVKQTTQTEDQRETDRKHYTKNNFTQHGQNHGFCTPPKGLKKDKSSFVDHGKRHHAQIDAEASYGKFRIKMAFIGCPKDTDQNKGKEFHNEESDCTKDRLTGKEIGEELHYPVFSSGTNIVTDNRNASGRHADGNRYGDLEELHDNTK